MPPRRKAVPFFLAMILTGAEAWAHPGHGATAPETVTHYLIEPSHAWWILLAIISVVMAAIFMKLKSLKTEKVRVRK